MTLLVNHHDPEASSEDIVDAVSGSHGLAAPPTPSSCSAATARRSLGW
jgi:hypothetical protein